MWCQGKRKGFSFDPVLAQFHTFLVVVLNVAFDGVVWMNKALLLSHEKKKIRVSTLDMFLIAERGQNKTQRTLICCVSN